MAKRTVNVCDVHANSGDLVPATTHSRLQLDSDTQELDLCETHAAELRAAIAGFLGAATPARRRSTARGTRPAKAGGSRARRAGGARTPASRSRSGRASAAFTESVRSWAREQGMDIKDRGRLPRAVVEQYTAAHPGSSS